MFASGGFRKPSKRARLAYTSILVLVVAGCETRDALLLPDIDGWESRQYVLGARNEWEFSARIAVRASDDGFNGKLRWAQDEDAFLATVSGPLGIGTVRIEGDGDAVILTDKDGVRTELRDVEFDLQYRYGWTIPVTSLRYWALGIPDPAVEAETTVNAAGHLTGLAQGEWNVAITRYREGAGQLLPNRLTATNAGTRVRLVIDNWRFYD